jgi:hypothetical protein
LIIRSSRSQIALALEPCALRQWRREPADRAVVVLRPQVPQ